MWKPSHLPLCRSHSTHLDLWRTYCTSDHFASLSSHFSGLVLHQRVLFGGQTVLHEGEGGITAVLWRGSLIAWMNPRGVKVYNVKSGQKVRIAEWEHSPCYWLMYDLWEYDMTCAIMYIWYVSYYHRLITWRYMKYSLYCTLYDIL